MKDYEDFDPLYAFCEMHHDRLIDGGNYFGPRQFGVKCKAFMWSRLDRPNIYMPVEPKIGYIALDANDRPENGPDIQKLRLDKVPGQTSYGYHLYILRGE